MKFVSKKKTSTSLNKTKFNKPSLLKDGSVPEKVIQRQILDWLKGTGLLFYRQNSGVLNLYGRKINLGPEGAPDIVVIVGPRGRFLGLEVKSARGVLRPGQRLFKSKLEATGGIFKVVRTLQEAMSSVASVIGSESDQVQV